MSSLFTESGVFGSAPAGVYVPVLKRVSHGSIRMVFSDLPSALGTRISQPLFPHQRKVIRDGSAADAVVVPARTAAAAAPAPSNPRLLNSVFMAPRNTNARPLSKIDGGRAYGFSAPSSARADKH